MRIGISRSINRPSFRHSLVRSLPSLSALLPPGGSGLRPFLPLRVYLLSPYAHTSEFSYRFASAYSVIFSAAPLWDRSGHAILKKLRTCLDLPRAGLLALR